jgi:hypothetical protein
VISMRRIRMMLRRLARLKRFLDSSAPDVLVENERDLITQGLKDLKPDELLVICERWNRNEAV